MRIADTLRAGNEFAQPGPKLRRVTPQPPDFASGDVVAAAGSDGLSLPGLLALTAPGHPQREAFLTALSESLRAGLHVSDPPALIESMITRGFDFPESHA